MKIFNKTFGSLKIIAYLCIVIQKERQRLTTDRLNKELVKIKALNYVYF